MFLWTWCMKKVFCCCFGIRRTQPHISTQEGMFLWGASHACLSKPLSRLDTSVSCLRILELNNGAVTKHRKNCECSPGQSLTVSHLPSMSSFEFLNLPGKVNYAISSLDHSQSLIFVFILSNDCWWKEYAPLMKECPYPYLDREKDFTSFDFTLPWKAP